MNPELTVLVPAYQEEDNLRRNLPLLLEAMGGCTAAYEILVVDDGSTDAGPDVAASFARRGPVRLVRHPRNLGPGAAVPTGVFWARGAWILLVPADLACDPADLRRVWEMRQDADVVVALRSARGDVPGWRRALSKAFVATLRGLTGSAVEQFTYIQMVRRALFEDLPLRSRGVFVTAEIILRAERAGLRLVQLPLAYRPRESGRASGASPRAMARAAWEMLVYFTAG